MKTSAARIHALVSRWDRKARVVGHDIGLMVAYAMPRSFRETEKARPDGCLSSGVAGWEAIYNHPNLWHFRFNGRPPKHW